MENFELLRSVTIGQYVPVQSVIHRLDPRTKVIGTLLLGLAISTPRALIPAVLLFLLLVGMAALARLPIPYVLSGLRPMIPFLLFLFLMQLLFQGSVVPCPVVYYEWWFVQITPCILQLVVLGAVRVVSFLFLVSLLTMTTTSSDLTHAIEILLSPLQRIGFPAHEVALANMIALRFVPTLVEELERIMKAQASRGGEIGAEQWYRPVQMARNRIPLIVPLFVNALRRAEDLVLAMEARCYVGGKGRTRFVQYSMRPLDWLALAAAAAVALVIWLAPWPSLIGLLPGF